MNDGFSSVSNVIPFPARLRVVPIEPPERVQAELRRDDPEAAVEHDGLAYDLAGLLRHLSPAELRQVGETAPRSGQTLWDEVVRRWPALAAGDHGGDGGRRLSCAAAVEASQSCKPERSCRQCQGELSDTLVECLHGGRTPGAASR